MEIRFTVLGEPIPQGSKARNRFGGGVREDNPRTKPWRQAVAAEAIEAMDGRDLLTGPLEVHAVFYFNRAKGHFGTGKNAEILKASAPLFHEKKPDVDKLQRAIGDSLTGHVMRDDSQIVHWNVWKLYGAPRAEILVRRVQPALAPDG